MNRIVFPFFLMLLLTPAICLAMGSDHKPGNLPPHDGWPKGVYDAVNKPNRVHGYWINSSDTLFYKGSSSDLQKMTSSLSQIDDVTIDVVLHSGGGVAKSPWSTNRIDSADWTVTIAGESPVTKVQNKIRIDIWLGGSVTIDELKFPRSINVESGKEIESFIERHRKQSK